MSRHGRDAAIAMDRSEQNSGSWRNPAVRRVMLTSLLAGILLLGIASVVVNTARAEPLPNGVPGTWALIFNEEFSANGLNTALWTPEWPSGPMSGQCTSPSLVSQPGNGYLYLQVRAQNSTCGGTNHPDTGSLVESNPADGKPGHGGFLYSYGYVEWHVYIVGWGGEAQGCPKGGCIPDWPALWSFPENEEDEIDTMEGLHGKACHTWHHHVSPIEETQGCQPGSYAGWHTYGVDWEPGILKFYYDGAQVGEVNSGYINSTAQYLMMDDVPPGSYGGQLVVPDEIVVDYVRVWQHPTPPTVSTGGQSGLQPFQATMEGSVNPNGFDTHYYFQYGKTTASESSTVPTDAGSGTSFVPVSATVTGLEPGTTYHYRIVAVNAFGQEAMPGSEQAFTTPGPVEAVTGAAAGLLEAQATLNGTVNPRGYDAKYYFQYGPTSSYGLATPEADAGGGEGTVPERATVTGLEPGVVYHYRLVATSGGVTSYGKDETFILTEEASSRWVVRNPLTTEQWLYYRGGNGNLDLWTWSGKEWLWAEREHEHKIAAGTSPTVVRNPATGEQWVYYQGSNGSIDLWGWNTKEWSWAELAGHGAAAGTSPTAVRDPSTGEQWVYYQGSNGSVDWWGWNTKEWGWAEHAGHGAAAGTSPTAVRDPSTGEQWVYYQGSNGSVDWWGWNTKEWGWAEHAGHGAAAGTSPTAVRDPSTGEQWVYYQGSNGSVDWWGWNTKEWGWAEHAGHGAAAGTSPTAVRDPSTGEQWVYYQGSNGSVDWWGWNTKEWGWAEHAGHGAAAGTSPTAVRDPSTGEQWVYYQGSNGSIDLWGWNTKEWGWAEYSGHPA